MRRARGGVVLLLALAAPAAPVAAQDAAPRVRARVTYIAGSNVYFDAGSGQGIRAQDTLAVFREADGARLGAVVVLSVTEASAVATFAGRPFALTRGTPLLLELLQRGEPAGADSTGAAAKADIAAATLKTADGQQAGADTTAAPAKADERQAGKRARAAPAATPAAARAVEPARAQHTTAPRVDGRLALDFEGMRTTSEPAAGEGWVDDVAAPTLRLRAAVTRLPGGLRIETNLRAAYRSSSAGLFEASPSLRVYQASVEKEFAALPLRLRLGRFYNPYESYGGYLDGVLARVGRQDFGAGVTLGYAPELGTEGFTTDLPRLSVFLDYHHRGRTLRYDMDLSFHDERPRSDTVAKRRYIGWSQHLTWNGFRIGQRLQADRAPGTGEWLISHLELFAAAPVAAGLHVNGRYALVRPESFPDAPGLPAERRERASAGLLLVGRAGSASVDGGIVRTQAGGTGRSFTASFLLPRTPALGFGFGASASYWSEGSFTSYHVAPSVTREFGASHVRGSFQVYGSEGALGAATYYGTELSVTFPLRRSAAGSLGARHRTGGGLTSSQILASIWTSF
ncbi:MAG TPA: hypothetical protein VIL18_06200 [Longimicrobiales bacterium]